MKSGVRITRDNAKAILQNIAAMDKLRLLVGIPAEKAGRKGDQATNPMLGFIFENGSPAQNIPPSPFLVPGVKKSQQRVVAVLKEGAKEGIMKVGGIEKSLHKAGLLAQAEVRRIIVDQEGFPELSARTLSARAQRGHKGLKRLIDTGQLLKSITYVIREKK
jgi:hypothetical protein